MATKEMNAANRGAYRHAMVNMLAFAWLEKNRPDVLDLCRAEANKKYPLVRRSKAELPKALEIK